MSAVANSETEFWPDFARAQGVEFVKLFTTRNEYVFAAAGGLTLDVAMSEAAILAALLGRRVDVEFNERVHTVLPASLAKIDGLIVNQRAVRIQENERHERAKLEIAERLTWLRLVGTKLAKQGGRH